MGAAAEAGEYLEDGSIVPPSSSLHANSSPSSQLSLMEGGPLQDGGSQSGGADSVPPAAAGDQTAHAARAAALRDKRPRAQRGKVAVAWLVNAVKQLGEPHGSAPRDVAKFAARALGLREDQLEVPVRLGLARAQRQGLLRRATAGKYILAPMVADVIHSADMEPTSGSCGAAPPPCRKRVKRSCKSRKRSCSRKRRRSCSRRKRRCRTRSRPQAGSCCTPDGRRHRRRGGCCCQRRDVVPKRKHCGDPDVNECAAAAAIATAAALPVATSIDVEFSPALFTSWSGASSWGGGEESKRSKRRRSKFRSIRSQSGRARSVRSRSVPACRRCCRPRPSPGRGLPTLSRPKARARPKAVYRRVFLQKLMKKGMAMGSRPAGRRRLTRVCLSIADREWLERNSNGRHRSSVSSD